MLCICMDSMLYSMMKFLISYKYGKEVIRMKIEGNLIVGQSGVPKHIVLDESQL